jgi:hypothetical protein
MAWALRSLGQQSVSLAVAVTALHSGSALGCRSGARACAFLNFPPLGATIGCCYVNRHDELERPMSRVVEAVKKAAPPAELQPSTYTLVALTTLTGLLVTLGIKEGTLDRMLAEHSRFSWAAFGLAVAAVGFTVWSFTYSGTREARAKKRWQRAAIVALLGSLVAGIGGAIALHSDRSPPRIKAVPKLRADGSTAVEVSVKHEKVSPGQHVFLLVEHLRHSAPKGRSIYDSIKPLYNTSIGADPNGVVDFALAVPLPPELTDNDYIGIKAWTGAEAEDCYAARGFRTGCVELKLSRPPERPQLRLAWKDRRTLAMTVAGKNIAAQTVSLLAVVTQPPPRRQLLKWSLAPSLHGRFSRTVSVRVPANTRRVCVVVSTVTSARRCRNKTRRPSSVWQMVTRPPT